MSDQQGGFQTFVCASCLEDEALQQFAQKRGASGRCDYCAGVPGTVDVVSIDDVVDFMSAAIEVEWCDPVWVSPYFSAEGGYLVNTIDSHELFEEIGFKVQNHDLMSHLLEAFSEHQWCQCDWQSPSLSENWASSWKRFELVVKHERRYTFWHSAYDGQLPSEPDPIPPSQMLNLLQAVINEVRMVKELPLGTLIWRARCHEKNTNIAGARAFCPPPIELATQPNRMSPAGVPMFYGASDLRTAYQEVLVRGDRIQDVLVSGAQFRSLIPLNIIDFTAIPQLPSYFAQNGPIRRHLIRFLVKFTEAVKRPITGYNQHLIDYVPTQVFTEFVRHVMKGPQRVPIHGMKYASARGTGDCYVIFADQSNCLPTRNFTQSPQILQFIEGSVRTGSAMDVKCSKSE